jgi:hypothetical protein
VQGSELGSYKDQACSFSKYAIAPLESLVYSSLSKAFVMKSTTSIGVAAALLVGAVSAQSFRRLGACPTLGEHLASERQHNY